MVSKGSPKQFDSAGEIQIWKGVCFWLFFQFVCYTQQINWIFFSVLFVALSHCDKQNFLLSHWATATNRIFVCRTESLRQTKFVYATKKLPKKTKICNKVHENVLNNAKKGTKVPKSAKKSPKVPKSWALLKLSAIFWQHIKILFVAVTQCDKQFFCLLQWFSATN